MLKSHCKRFMPLLMIGLGTFTLSAKTISPEEALSRVASKAYTPGIVRAPASSAKLVRCLLTQKGQSAIYLYDVSNRPGYMILSADDKLPAMLGYSETGNLSDTDLPEGLQWWLKMMTDEAQTILDTVDDDENEGVYTPPSLGPAIEPLVKSTWGQTAPYNIFTPIFDDEQSPTGCVATALAQVMNYHKWPINPKGRITYDTSRPAQSYSIVFDGMTFDWDLITDAYDDQSTEESKIAVSNLMKAVAYGVKMNYAKSSSGATDANALEAMKTYFGYSSDARMLRRESFTRDEWDSMLYSFLSAGLPLYYTGRDAVWLFSGGHAFVCDGYDGNGYFHYNWGWDGKYNGWFLTTCLVPAGTGTGGYINGYNYTQSIMANLHPDNGREFKLYDYVLGTDFNFSTSTLSISANLIKGLPGENFEVALSFTNSDSETPIICVLGNATTGKQTWKVPAKFLDGLDKEIIYDFRLVWRPDTKTEWKRVTPEASGLVVYNAAYMGGHLTWDNDAWKFTQAYVDQNPMNLMITDIKLNDEDYYLSGNENTMTLSIINNGSDYEYHAGRCYAVNTATGKEELLINTNFELSPSGTKNYKFTITKALPAGDYSLRFINVNTLQEIPTDKTYTMKVHDQSDVVTFDDGTFVYAIIPNQPLVLTGTLSGDKVGGDIVIPAAVNYNDEIQVVGKIKSTLSNLLDKNTLTKLRIACPITSLESYELSSYKVLTELHLPESLREIGKYGCAFNNALTKLTLPSRLDNMGDCAFYGLDALEELTLPIMEIIPTRSFYNVKILKEINVPEGVKEICEAAFCWCDECTSIILPSTLESIGWGAFTTYNRLPMEVKVMRAVPPTADPDAFTSSTYRVSTLIVPKGTKNLYMSDPTWSKFSKIEEFVVTGIDNITESSSADYVWFSIDGMRMSSKPSAPGIYIRLNRSTDKVEKLILK